jgi:hypothetical protein
VTPRRDSLARVDLELDILKMSLAKLSHGFALGERETHTQTVSKRSRA